MTMRPVDLAREYGLTAQAIRNYEAAGILPRADRSASGHRRYTAAHVTALRAFRALAGPVGHGTARRIMQAVTADDPDTALELMNQAHLLLDRDRQTLAAVGRAAAELTVAQTVANGPHRSIGELAARLQVTPATLREWERRGILRPGRDPATGSRRYAPADVRDAELAHLLRRGRRPLAEVATVVHEVRAAGSVAGLDASLEQWRRGVRSRGIDLLRAGGMLERALAERNSTSPAL